MDSNFSMIKNGDSVIAAVSGGADSVCLLSLLFKYKNSVNFNLYVVHINHCLRGQESDRDEQFTRMLCKSMGIEFFAYRRDVTAYAAEKKLSTEEAARMLRYECLQKAAEQLDGALIMTAHTANDNTETVIYNLIKGSGSRGLCGIPEKRGNIYRPLLNISRCEVEEYLKQNNLSYVTDSSNLTDDFTRNKIRNKVIPVLKQINPQLDAAVTRLSKILKDQDDFFLKKAAEILAENCNNGLCECNKLLLLEPPLLSAAIRLMAQNSGVHRLDSMHIFQITEIINVKSGSVTLPGGFIATAKQGIFRIYNPMTESGVFCKPAVSGKEYAFGEKVYKFTEENNVNKNLLNNYLPCDIINGNTCIRTRKEGDVFRLPERNVTKTLKKLFNEMKIPCEKRGSLLVVANGSTVVWLEGVGTSAEARLTGDEEKAVHIEIYGNTP